MIQHMRKGCRFGSKTNRGIGTRWGLVLLLITLAMPGVSSAAVEHVLRCSFIVSGPIERTDVTPFQAADCSSEDTVIIYLGSPGGDVDAAMAIGRWARAHNAVTIVDSIGSADARCYSSCALIYIGGVIRMNLGEIGLHRPYLAGPPRTASEVRAAVYQMIQGVQEYVTEMGVTPDFTHTMFNTLPSEIRIFSGGEILDLVPERDLMGDELRVAQDAAWYGLSTDEYRRREAESEQHCKLVGSRFSDLKNCREAVHWGLSQSVYMQRVDTMWVRCTQADTLTDEDKAAWRDSGGDKAGHPLEIKARQCRIAIMQGRQWPPKKNCGDLPGDCRTN